MLANSLNSVLCLMVEVLKFNLIWRYSMLVIICHEEADVIIDYVSCICFTPEEKMGKLLEHLLVFRF